MITHPAHFCTWWEKIAASKLDKLGADVPMKQCVLPLDRKLRPSMYTYSLTHTQITWNHGLASYSRPGPPLGSQASVWSGIGVSNWMTHLCGWLCMLPSGQACGHWPSLHSGEPAVAMAAYTKKKSHFSFPLCNLPRLLVLCTSAREREICEGISHRWTDKEDMTWWLRGTVA